MPLGELFDTFWRLVRAKLVPKSSSNYLLVEKVVVHGTICFLFVFVFVCSPDVEPQNDPRWLQEPRRLRDCPDCFVLPLPLLQDGAGVVSLRFFFRLAVWGRFLNPLGPLLESFGGAPGSFWGALGSVRRQDNRVFHLPYFVLGCS